ncbi:MAG: DUF4390 domain-containing protein [Arenicellales bacterium]|nr:DUF4390 domain-containing protein [Arenicellales bacterium]
MFVFAFTVLLASTITTADFKIVGGGAQITDQHLSSHATLDLSLDPRSATAIVNGIPIIICIDLKLVQNKLWPWSTTFLEWRYPVKLSYHSLSRRFTVTDQRKQSTAVFHTLGEALRQLDRFSVIEALPATIAKKQNLVVRIRARIDTESLPAPLRLMSELLPPWNEQSQWHEWPVQ